MIEHEIVRHEKLKDIRIFLNTIRMRSLHMHRDMELLFVLDGKGTVLSKDKKHVLQKGDCLLINAYESHEIICQEKPLTAIFIQFSNHFLREYFHAVKTTVFLDDFPRDRFTAPEYEVFTGKILRLAKEYLAAEEYFELRCISLFAGILESLLTHLRSEELTENDYSVRKKTNLRIERIASYIDAHFQEPVRLSDIAGQEGITVTHLSHAIKENFGMTFQEYLKGKRLECALRQIFDPSLSLSEIAMNSGFSELKYMSAAFRDAFGLSAQEYKARKLPYTLENKNEASSEYIYPGEEALTVLDRFDIPVLLA